MGRRHPQSRDDYARVIGYLGKSNLVRGVQPMQARGDGMLLKLSLATDLAHFLDAVGMERTLRRRRLGAGRRRRRDARRSRP